MEASKICNAKAEENITYFVGTDLISEAWNACQNAYKSRDFYKIEYKNVLIIAFSGAPNSRDYVTDNDFDECDINYNFNDEFNCLVDGDSENPKPAMVRKAFLDRFLCMLRSSNLKTKILEFQKDIVEKKTIIFTGHSFGGAIASLWTLWTLEKRHKIPPLCITFGCPLVGDKIFAKAIEREKWSHYFCHIVSRNDIVPRICFSPFKSSFISKALDELLPYWYDSMRNRKAENQTKAENQSKVENQKTVQDGSHPLSKENSQEFIKQVISDASQVLTHETTALVVGPANLVGGAAKDLIKSSPYRPFGYYGKHRNCTAYVVFCSGKQQTFWGLHYGAHRV
ncbi:protein EDS1 [Cryptomeria japonica]|uniref:protein EDS1 n=1 Tax=Cryptomeria japonica TaxID=3369 RepID=UPI0027DA21BE|nr:protein EDS1 [Cryptomeria japonica]